MDCYVNVAVAGAAFRFDKLYTYSVPEPLVSFAVLGARVLVPFGSSAPRMGVILDSSEKHDNIKEIIDIERGEPALDDEFVKLIFFLKQQTLCSYDDALRTVLPKNSRMVAGLSGEQPVISNMSSTHMQTVYRRAELPITPRLSEKQREVFDILESPMSYREIYEKTGVSRNVVNRLIENGIVEKTRREKSAVIYQNYDIGEDYALTAAQKEAFFEIKRNIDAGQKQTTLLHGVTSSGKTLIYSQLIREIIQRKKTALLLVPEIALATQLIYRLKNLFGERVGIIHSGLSDTERQLQWQSIRSGGCDIVVGTRSAVFAPLADIGVIIVDEEQEQSYLSEKNPRYHAISVARFRAKYHGAHILLSSATPSIEAYHAAAERKYNLVILNDRYGNMPMPKVKVVDMRNELLEGNGFCISEYLKNEIDIRLERKEQAILLLNRRGYRTVSICSGCKTVVKCKSCDVPLVYHKQRERHVCHYCGYSRDVSESCDECGGAVRHTGIGTQKIEEELELLFPDAKVLRIDTDSTSRKHSLEKSLTAFSRGEYDIIIGTQMVAKGLDFKNVTLAGVLSIDQFQLMSSFRANERAFALLTQVIGRSGRGEKVGEAVIQTLDPQNPIIMLAAKQDYLSFYKNEIVSRKLHLYPPFCAVSSVVFLGSKQEEVSAAADTFAGMVKEKVKVSGGSVPIRILGPSPMRVAYVSDMFRYRITLKSRGDRAFRDMIFVLAGEFYGVKESKKVKMSFNFFYDNEI